MLNPTFPGFLIKPLYIPLLTNLQGTIHEHLYKILRTHQFPHRFPILTKRRHECSQYHQPSIQHQTRHFSYAPDILSTPFVRETKVLVQTFPYIIAIQPIGMDSTAEQLLRSDEPTSELQSLMRISHAVFCLKKKQASTSTDTSHNQILLSNQYT